ncbi:hypothetical protein PAEH1_02580 [Paenalcaligenes hominis]|uniref:Uncharacterized protein n=1 Tax=Paenalcaligenes hominis TaxID=643674 RepID=A0A1U9JY70_9BURK|nr:hypothetical protein [Paenalcaligenes hominis]AQS50712.1 hypothetical protein PAEH1_02580 [Paenalcaligenes hominis]
MWHRQGKVSLTKGSDVVTGVGTAWVENIRVGDAFQGPDGKLYQVINVASNEALAISPAYEGNTATNLNYWIVPVPGYSKTQADRLSLIISKLDGDILSATDAADRAQVAAQQAQQWGNEAAASAAAALQSEQSAALSADIAEQARDDAVAVVTGGTASLEPEAGKIPIAGADAAIKQAWVKDLEFELDRLRVATNKTLYGDGPYPVIDLQFQGAKYLDPRIQFTRASLDWDSQGREYEINEPVLTDKGLWASGSRTNMQTRNASGQGWSATRATLTKDGDWHILTPASTAAYAWLGTQPLIGDTQYCASAKIRKGFSGDKSIRLHPNGFGEYKSTILNEDGSFTVSGVGVTGGVFDKGDHYLIFVSAKSVTTPVPSACFIWDDIGLSPVSFKDVQLETGSKPTPYIPTEDSQVTVAPSFQSAPKQPKGDYTVFVDFTPIAPANGSNVTGVLSIFKSSSNAIAITLFGESLRLTFYGQGTSSRSSTSFDYGRRYKAAITFREDKVWFFLNGQMILADHGLTVGLINDFDTLVLGSHILTGIATKGAIFFHGVNVFDKNLTDEQIQEITA